MEDKNAVIYFLFNDRKSTLRCSFILVALILSFNCILVLFAFRPFSVPNTTLSYFVCSLFPFHFILNFIANPPPTRLHFQSFHPSFPSPFLFNSPPFPLVYLLLNPNQNSFSTPPPSLCNKGMATLSCNSYDIAPQKQCNYHLKALLLERKSYSFAPQRLYPQPTRA